VHRRPHWRLVHRVLPAPGHPFQGRYHRSDSDAAPASHCATCAMVSVKLRVPSASPEMFRNSQISSASHAGLRKVASTALRLTGHLALSKSTLRGDM
jgi:hypothetical protein